MATIYKKLATIKGKELLVIQNRANSPFVYFLHDKKSKEQDWIAEYKKNGLVINKNCSIKLTKKEKEECINILKNL